MIQYLIELEIYENTNTLEKRITDFFLSENFKIKSFEHGKMTFTRGNILRNYFAFNPSKWKTVINIKLSEVTETATHLTLNIDVITTGQMVTAEEEYFWKEYVSFLKYSIKENKNFLKVSKHAANTAFKKNWEYIKELNIASLIALPFVVAISATVGIMTSSFKTGIITSIFMGLIAFSVTFGAMIYKIKKGRNK